jgi:SAM-dependent methyltransferase
MGPPKKDLYEEGLHYDLLMPGPNDLQFYQRHAAKYGTPVLELGCGSGRLSIPLAAAGVDITGIDMAASMLAVARNKAGHRGVAIRFVQVDCRSFSLGRQFRLIFFANNSLSHLLQRAEVEACLRCVRQHLAPGGRFIIDVFTPSARILARDATQQYPVGRYDDPDGGGLITVTETSRYDPATQVNHLMWHYQSEGKLEISRVPLKLRMFYPQEIDALLSYNGFVVENKYGDYDENSYGSESPKQLIVCS